MPRTRSTKPAPGAKAEANDTSSKSVHSMPEHSVSPSRVLVLPNQSSKDSRIVSLPHPRHNKPTRYLVCPETGIYEFTKIAAPSTIPRSWLIETSPGDLQDAGLDEQREQLTAQISSGADLFVATAVDPAFLILPALFATVQSRSEDTKRMFLSSDDHFDALAGGSDSPSDLSETLRCHKSRALLESRMEAICDSVDAGDEKMFRINEEKLVEVLLSKAKAMSAGPLPPSMEEKFVNRALEAPLLTQRSVAVAEGTGTTQSTPTTTSTPQSESADSQSSGTTTNGSAASDSTAATSVDTDQTETSVTTAIKASEEVTTLQRLKVAFGFICAGYIPQNIAPRLQELSQNPEMSGADFAPLETYMKELAKARAEAAAARAYSDYSRKRRTDDEAEEARAEKRRKIEEEKKRKANESRGVKNLKKVNTSGMKKMSDFFKKK